MSITRNDDFREALFGLWRKGGIDVEVINVDHGERKNYTATFKRTGHKIIKSSVADLYHAVMDYRAAFYRLTGEAP
jgi:hypothetical protein